MSENKKQERMVCHLEYGGDHYYFGNLKVLAEHFGKDKIGISYKSLANFFAEHSKENKEIVAYTNQYCTIRRAAIVTSQRNR